MADTSYEENLIYNIKDYLATNLGGYLTEIEIARGDGIVLTDIKKYDVGDKDIYALQQYPAVLINPDEQSYQPLSLGSDNLTMRLLLTVAIKGGKTENLTIKAMRYSSAVRECINADRTAGGVVDRVRPSGVVHYARPAGMEDKKVMDITLIAEKSIPISG